MPPTSRDGGRHGGERPRLLILSFVPMVGDPRVMKQVLLFAASHEVVTCAPGAAPHPDVEHVEIPIGSGHRRGRIGELFDEIAREREWFAWTYSRVPAVRQVARLLRGRAFDAVIANDMETLGAARKVAPWRSIHGDLHEFWPGMPSPDTALGARQRRYREWMTRAHGARAASTTTVGSLIADRYRQFGLDPEVVTNSPRYRDLDVTDTSSPLRIVHSGYPFLDRGLADMMRAVASSDAEITLDLMLMRTPVEEYAQLEALARDLGPRIRLREPVAADDVVTALHDYDVGMFVLPPVNENYELALPNKFFDFIQARLAVVVGPSPEMAAIVDQRGLGVVSEDFSQAAVISALEGLTTTSVAAFKRASDAAARELSAEAQVQVWAAAVERIIARRR
jgi:hypothetical protein